ncbi:hypothetical protein OQJ18_12670 [Fluoribacter dumoffii]|uniref:hypothetical protein n=1 Tax=Fluoribacter dumoffii TaxID=463 RepID=UPI00026C8280|nr:hypothetical protein [Fluoribacter dumoffii]MCW8387441.1 hypothetical protein [Fluoribacter dumoffii]MCW8417051.1 hypothetical protein [Fluoribacter dumoffii]MCW8455109.1 hypothetical protein [Fluoribacter dumoffii]MCW8460814.1 hypothetical protein [Fluoribacter dumoffii]MCW8484256.1 hypothetical protein [Fluoribacter dumoffii]
MGKKNANARQTNGQNNTKQSNSHSSQLFFNQKQKAPPLELQTTQTPQEMQQPPQELILETATDVLLAAILQELKTQNMIALLKLKAQKEQEQEEMQAAEKMQEEDQAHFKEIQSSMYV